MPAFDPGPLADVAVEEQTTLVFVRDFRQAPERVWRALTEPAELDRWAPFRPDRDLAVTGPATLTMIDGQENPPLTSVVHRAKPPHLLEYTWGPDLLRWELATTDAGGTRLTLRHVVQDRTWLSKVAAGWHLCLVVAEHLLDGDPVDPIRGEDARNHGWADLDEAYAAQLGITTEPGSTEG
jgi:uncharacterized protein YndB with AHSA1/START domain